MVWLRDFYEKLNQTVCKADGEIIPLEDAMTRVQELLISLRARDGALWWVGNGGSAAICSHLAQDVMGKLDIRSIAISDAAMLTCSANDFGYASVYSYPLEKMAREGDMVIMISSSGKSDNIIQVSELAHSKGLNTVCLSGFSADNRLFSEYTDVAFYLPSDSYGMVEVGHELLLHCLIETLQES